MSPRGSLEGYEFTFENFLDSSEITADVSGPIQPPIVRPPPLTPL